MSRFSHALLPSRMPIAALLCALLCSASLVLAAPAAHADGPFRVLLTGDSITQGRHGDYTWRYRLYREFRHQHVPVDFVGSLSRLYLQPGYATASYADPSFDRDHFARFGWQLSSMVHAIGDEVRHQDPDMVVLAAGINDFRDHADDPDIVDTTAEALQAWITNVRAAKPNIRILLSPVLAVDTARTAVLEPLIDSYNVRMAAIASKRNSVASPITVATTDQGWNPKGYMSYDGLHPTPTGETFIAQRIAEALRRLKVLHDAPHIYAFTPWRQTQRPRVAVHGKRATLTWSRQGLSGVRVAVRRPAGRWVISPRLNTTGHAVVALAVRGTYQFRLGQVRGRMSGPWGPIAQARAVLVITRKPPAPAHVKVDARGVHWTASPRARSYVVKFHRAHQKRWTTRRTSRHQVLAGRVVVAKVRAVNARGASAWHRARR